MFAPLRSIILVGDNGGAICWKASLYLSEMDAADWHTLAGQARSAEPRRRLCGLETAYVEEQFRLTGSSRDSTPRWNMSLIWRT